MTIHPSPPRCQDCLDHDAETRRQVQALFSQDETMLLTMLVSSSLHHRIGLHAKMAHDDIQRLAVQRDIDFAGCVLGKFLVSLDPKYKEGLARNLKRMGIELEVKHEPCPHGTKEREFKPALAAVPAPPPESI